MQGAQTQIVKLTNAFYVGTVAVFICVSGLCSYGAYVRMGPVFLRGLCSHGACVCTGPACARTGPVFVRVLSSYGACVHVGAGQNGHVGPVFVRCLRSYGACVRAGPVFVWGLCSYGACVRADPCSHGACDAPHKPSAHPNMNMSTAQTRGFQGPARFASMYLLQGRR